MGPGRDARHARVPAELSCFSFHSTQPWRRCGPRGSFHGQRGAPQFCSKGHPSKQHQGWAWGLLSTEQTTLLGRGQGSGDGDSKSAAVHHGGAGEHPWASLNLFLHQKLGVVSSPTSQMGEVKSESLNVAERLAHRRTIINVRFPMSILVATLILMPNMTLPMLFRDHIPRGVCSYEGRVRGQGRRSANTHSLPLPPDPST